MKISLTNFQLNVLSEIAKIPFGETRTYKQIAIAVGKPKASRAVGMVCNKNPFPFIIPCHRVVGSKSNKKDNLAGYAFGLELKSQILNFENNLKAYLKI
ncbi:MAG: MGMT family protein [Rickettsiales bacterium]|nr:MGMT family protein [Rickettsiales bacterium]